MDLAAIRTFCRAIEAGNLTAAARAMHITKSVASRRIQALEEDLGVKLLMRTTRGVTATDQGAVLYERFVRILDDLEDARQAATGASEGLVGQLRFTAPRSFTDKHLARPIAEFMKLHPRLSFDMTLTDERVDIIGGGYDLGLRITAELADTSLVARKIVTLRSHIVASPGYLEAHGTPRRPEDLADHNCVLYSNAPTSGLRRFDGPDGPVSVRVGGTARTNSGDVQLEIARQGLAIATLPRFYLTDALARGEVVTVLDDFPSANVHLFALYPEKRLLPLKVRAFIDFLLGWFRADGASDGL